MREVSTDTIYQALYEMLGHMAFIYPDEIRKSLEEQKEKETGMAHEAMEMLVENARIAAEEHIPICQDTGMVTVYLTIGQDVHLTGRPVRQAVNEAVAQSYTDYYLRASVVDDPLFDRTNTRDNTPCVLYIDMTEGEEVIVEATAKGFGSENMSRIGMLKPAQGRQGVADFVVDTIAQAGPNACPPMTVGVGIGGTFDYAAVLAKKALCLGFTYRDADERYNELTDEILTRANALQIGPMGLGGKTTALHVNILHYPTHIAGMPVAVNICCHACRHERRVL
jgi:fumarate hydratase subunit alpha